MNKKYLIFAVSFAIFAAGAANAFMWDRSINPDGSPRWDWYVVNDADNQWAPPFSDDNHLFFIFNRDEDEARRQARILAEERARRMAERRGRRGGEGRPEIVEEAPTGPQDWSHMFGVIPREMRQVCETVEVQRPVARRVTGPNVLVTTGVFQEQPDAAPLRPRPLPPRPAGVTPATVTETQQVCRYVEI